MNIVVIGARSLLREGLVSLLSTLGFESINEAIDIKHVTARVDAKSSNTLIIYVVRPIEDIVSTVGEIRAWEPTAKIVFVAPSLDLEVMSACFAAGACGYLLGTISREALRGSLKLVDSGEKVFPSELASQLSMLASKVVSPETNSEPLDSELSPREIDILRCLTNGQSNKVIARNLDIAEATVKVHIKRILKKTHVTNRTQAALWGMAEGIATTPETPRDAKSSGG